MRFWLVRKNKTIVQCECREGQSTTICHIMVPFKWNSIGPNVNKHTEGQELLNYKEYAWDDIDSQTQNPFFKGTRSVGERRRRGSEVTMADSWRWFCQEMIMSSGCSSWSCQTWWMVGKTKLFWENEENERGRRCVEVDRWYTEWSVKVNDRVATQCYFFPEKRKPLLFRDQWSMVM